MQSHSLNLLLFLVAIFSLLILTKCGKLEPERNKPRKERRDIAFCENTVSAFFVSDNVRVLGNTTAKFGNVSEKSCLNLCTNNRDNRGRSVFCGSATYDQSRRICTMYRKSSEPDGDLGRHNNADDGTGVRYFEKFCLPEDLPMDCANKQFIRVDEYILKGYAQTTTQTTTLADCVASCVREKEFECRSAMYFYEEGECILNVESAITQPEDFMKPNEDDHVVFFHNGCIQQTPPQQTTEPNQELGTRKSPKVLQLADDAGAEDEEHHRRSSNGKIVSNNRAINTEEDSNEENMDSSEDASPSVTSSAENRVFVAAAEKRRQQQQKVVNETVFTSTSISSTALTTQSLPVTKIHKIFNENNSKVQVRKGISSADRQKFSSTAPNVSESTQNVPTSVTISPSATKIPQKFDANQTVSKHESKGNDFSMTSTSTMTSAIGSHENGSQNSDESGPDSMENSSEKEKDEITEAIPIITRQVSVRVKANDDTKNEHKSMPTSSAPVHISTAENRSQTVQIKTSTDQKLLYGAKSLVMGSDGLVREQQAGQRNQPMNSTVSVPNLSSTRSTQMQPHLASIPAEQEEVQHSSVPLRGPISAQPPSKPQKYLFKDSTKQLNLKEIKKDIHQPLPAVQKEIITAESIDSAIKQQEKEDEQQQTLEENQSQAEETEVDKSGSPASSFSNWGKWTSCRFPGERRTRRRKCLDLRRCRGPLMQVDYCPRNITVEAAGFDDEPQHSNNDGQLQHQENPGAQAQAVPLSPASNRPPPPHRPPEAINLSKSNPNLISKGSPPSALPEHLFSHQPNKKDILGTHKNASFTPQIEARNASAVTTDFKSSDSKTVEEQIWSPWNGVCQHFASTQPCQNGQIIGFESRECLAPDASKCKRAPFFRYCTIPC